MNRQSRGRHGQVPEWAFSKPVMHKPPSTLHVYVAMCVLANYKDRTGDADWKEISELTGLGRTVIYRAIKGLRSEGIIGLQEDGNYALPLDEPCGKLSQSADAESQSADDSVPIGGFVPLSTEISETVEALNELLATRYSAFAGTPLVNYRTKKWETDMRLLIERGSPDWASPQRIEPDRVRKRINGIFDNLATPGADGFCWAANIRSPGKLRAKWDQVTVAASRMKPKTTGTVNRPEIEFDPDAPRYGYA